MLEHPMEVANEEVWRDLSETLEPLLPVLQSRADSSPVRLCLNSSDGTAQAKFDVSKPVCPDLSGASPICQNCSARTTYPAQIRRTNLPCGRSLVVPMQYQQKLFGNLLLPPALEVETASTEGKSETTQLTALARRLTHRLKRQDLQTTIHLKQHRQLRCLGTSSALTSLDGFIEAASQVTLPVLLLGEAGTEVEFVAHALHVAGCRQDGPLVRLHLPLFIGPRGEALEVELNRALDEGRDGTLLLEAIDQLPLSQQVGFSMFLSEHWQPTADHARLIATVETRPDSLDLEDRLYAPLLRQLNGLQFKVPALRQRRSDLRRMARYFLDLATPVGQQRELTETALRLLEAYPWPGNLDELQRTMAQVAILSEETTIRLDDLRRLQPHLLTPLAEVQVDSLRLLSIARRHQIQTEEQHLRLACRLLAGEAVDKLGPAPLHAGLVRALTFLRDQHSPALRLAELARHAHLSPSHLAALLREQLGTSFKKLHAALHLLAAVRLFHERPELSITEIAKAAGFSELRQCERTFQQLLGCSPVAFRQGLQPAA